MAKKLYVGSLSYSTTEDDLRTLFAEAGTVVSVTVITDRDSGMSKGFGFVEMQTDAEGQAAITKFNGRDLAGRTLTVSEARPPRERSSGGGEYGRGGGYGGGRDRRKGPGGRGGRRGY